jgi:transcriptional regulator with XRE-family HTH domain
MKKIAEKLKAFRLAGGMALKRLARRVGGTDGYPSQLERGRTNPSFMILKKIASALRVKVVDFFLEPEIEENDVVCEAGERVKKRFRRGDAKIETLVQNIQNKRMQPFYTTIEPEEGSTGSYSHIGEEFGIVLQGEREMNLNGKAYRLKKMKVSIFRLKNLMVGQTQIKRG